MKKAGHKIVAIDFGLKRTGLAITDSACIIASPLETVDSSHLMEHLKKLTQREKISHFVLGYPTQADGSDSHVTENVRLLSEVLKKEFPEQEMHLIDERYTSSEASQILNFSGKQKHKREKGNVDKIAASLLLDRFLQQFK